MKGRGILWGAGLLALSGCSDVFTEPFHYGTVEVEAVRRSGEAVPGVELVLFSGTRHFGYAATDSGGRADFPYVPFGPMGVTAEPPVGYRPLDLAGGWATTFRMEEGEERRLTFTYLKFGPGTVIVRTIDEEEAPIEGVEIELFSPETVVERTRTDSTGTRTFLEVPFGDYGVRALPGRGYTIPVGEELRAGIIVEDGVIESLVFHLRRCLGRIRATARDAQGVPIAGVGVTLYEADGVVEEGATGSDGERLFGPLPCGDYGARVATVPGYRLLTPAQGFLDGLVVGPGDERTAAFTFARCLGAIRVRVVDNAGTPLADAGLQLYSHAGVLAEARTSILGEHEFREITCGPDYGVRVVAPQGFTVEEGRGTSYIDGILVSDEPAAPITFVLTR